MFVDAQLRSSRVDRRLVGTRLILGSLGLCREYELSAETQHAFEARAFVSQQTLEARRGLSK